MMKELAPSAQLQLTTLVVLALGIIFILNAALVHWLGAVQPFGLHALSDVLAGACFILSAYWIHRKSTSALALALGVLWLQFLLPAFSTSNTEAQLGLPFWLSAAFVLSVTFLLWPSFKAIRALRAPETK